MLSTAAIIAILWTATGTLLWIAVIVEDPPKGWTQPPSSRRLGWSDALVAHALCILLASYLASCALIDAFHRRRG